MYGFIKFLISSTTFNEALLLITMIKGHGRNTANQKQGSMKSNTGEISNSQHEMLHMVQMPLRNFSGKVLEYQRVLGGHYCLIT